MKSLRAFVADYSPFHQTLVNEMSYSELVEVVKEIAKEMGA